MRVVIDVEANSLVNPSKIWVIVCKDIDTGELHVFKSVEGYKSAEDAKQFLQFASQVTYWVGHNWLGWDYDVLNRLVGLELLQVSDMSLDTLILSKLVNYSRKVSVKSPAKEEAGHSSSGDQDGTDVVRQLTGHSIESYGDEFGYPKLKFSDFTKYSQELEDRCVRDVEICLGIFRKFHRYIVDPGWHDSILLEHRFQCITNVLSENGFAFNVHKANNLLEKVSGELGELDAKILTAFPPKEKLIREFVPRLTKFGTISRTSVPRALWQNIPEYEAGRTYRHTSLVPFNPASHKQVIEVLNQAGWKPYEKTKAHIEAERDLGRNSRHDEDGTERLRRKLDNLKSTGWKINEANLTTLPSNAPSPARLLAKRILLESRRRTLTEWLSLVLDDGRIHGKFYGIGAWTHRMAHQQPNTANIPNEYDLSGNVKLLGKDMRSLWIAPKRRLLVGVDAEGIQLRIFAHYIDDKEFTDALVRGKKSNKSDPHSLNQKILGSVCKSRQTAKRFIYALLLGAGLWKLSQILECSELETQQALGRLLGRYEGWRRLKETDIPRDAKRGYFVGLDGRKVTLPGDTLSERRHLAMSGYLQNGEAIAMKLATTLFYDKLKDYNAKLVNLVHDEWQTECPNNMDSALGIASMQSEALRMAGEQLGLRCPLAGSYYNDELRDYTIGTNWSVTH